MHIFINHHKWVSKTNFSSILILWSFSSNFFSRSFTFIFRKLFSEINSLSLMLSIYSFLSVCFNRVSNPNSESFISVSELSRWSKLGVEWYLAQTEMFEKSFYGKYYLSNWRQTIYWSIIWRSFFIVFLDIRGLVIFAPFIRIQHSPQPLLWFWITPPPC